MYWLGIDIGTGGSRALLVGANGKAIGNGGPQFGFHQGIQLGLLLRRERGSRIAGFSPAGH